jgi:hypothetical protein
MGYFWDTKGYDLFSATNASEWFLSAHNIDSASVPSFLLKPLVEPLIDPVAMLDDFYIPFLNDFILKASASLKDTEAEVRSNLLSLDSSMIGKPKTVKTLGELIAAYTLINLENKTVQYGNYHRAYTMQGIGEEDLIGKAARTYTKEIKKTVNAALNVKWFSSAAEKKEFVGYFVAALDVFIKAVLSVPKVKSSSSYLDGPSFDTKTGFSSRGYINVWVDAMEAHTKLRSLVKKLDR